MGTPAHETAIEMAPAGPHPTVTSGDAEDGRADVPLVHRNTVANEVADWCTIGNSRVWNRCETAVRCGIAAGASALLILNSTVSEHLPLAVLLGVISVIGVQPTLGATLGFSLVAMRAVLGIAVPCALVGLVVPNTAATFWVGVCLVVIPVHFVSDYPGKKLVLAFGAVFLFMRWKGSDAHSAWFFPFSSLRTPLAACVCSIAGTLLPYPRTGWSVATRRLRNAKALASHTFSEFTSSMVKADGHEHVFIDGVVHLSVLRDLVPALRSAARSAEWESRVWCALRSFAAVLTLVPALVLQLTSMLEYGLLANDVAGLARRAAVLDAMHAHINAVNSNRVRSSAGHTRLVHYFRDPLTDLGRLLQSDEDVDPKEVAAALRRLSDATERCRAELLYKEKGSVTPDEYMAFKRVVTLIHQFARVVVDTHQAAREMEGAPWTPFQDVFVAPFAWLYGTLCGFGAKALHLWGALRACKRDSELLESVKTVGAQLAAVAISEVCGWEPSFWAAMTVAFISSPTASGSLTTSLNRVLGTVFGSAFGYVVLRSLEPRNWGIGLAFALWCVLAGYVRAGQPRYSYAGQVASLTAAIVLFGYDLDTQQSSFGHQTVEEFAFSRIQQTLTATIVYMVFVYAIDPVRPSRLVKEGLRDTLVNMQQLHAQLFDGFPTADVDDKEVGSRVRDIARAVDAQAKYLPESVDEIELWDVPFQVEAFKDILAEEVALRADVGDLVAACGACRGSPRAVQLLVSPVLAEVQQLCSAMGDLHCALISIAEGGLTVCSDTMASRAVAVQTASDALAARFNDHVRSYIELNDTPMTSVEDAEAFSKIVHSLCNAASHAVELGYLLRAFKVKEHTQRYRLV